MNASSFEVVGVEKFHSRTILDIKKPPKGGF
jgi:hypothetical protein